MRSYRKKISVVHKALGISENYEASFGLPMIAETGDLVEIEHDVFSRPQFLMSTAVKKWQNMKLAAEQDGICLQVVSAFRSVDYQAELIAAKLEKGISLEDILKVNAAPGYSEHHSGCALDLTTPGCQVLSEDFEETAAFKWLAQRANNYGFSLSYPKNSINKIIYEPWHWSCLSDNGISQVFK